MYVELLNFKPQNKGLILFKYFLGICKILVFNCLESFQTLFKRNLLQH